jgi:hypothetical protein
MKRFTETTKWSDPWFRKLPPRAKLLWYWLLDNCDAAGVIDPDLELAGFQCGFEINQSTVEMIGDRLDKLPCGKYLIPKFIPFQYGELSSECRAHNAVFASLEKHGIDRVSKGYPKGIQRGQEKEKDKDKKGSVRGDAERIYAEYPNKVGKPDALRAIERCLKNYSADFLLERTVAFAKARRGDVSFCPHPSTWFNQERFNDDPSTWTPKTGDEPKPRANPFAGMREIK